MPLPRYLDGPREDRKKSLGRWAKTNAGGNYETSFWEEKRLKWEANYDKAHFQQKRYGTDRSELMYRKYNQEEVSTEIDPKKVYTPSQLDEIASAILREDSKTELCRECGEQGSPTGNAESVPEGIEDENGNQLALKFEEYLCPQGHLWYPGEGQLKGIGGDNPILFEEHFQSRKRREIYTAQGTPDPSIVSGMYNRVHPQGRKVNSEEQRKRNGASFYR